MRRQQWVVAAVSAAWPLVQLGRAALPVDLPSDRPAPLAAERDEAEAPATALWLDGEARRHWDGAGNA